MTEKEMLKGLDALAKAYFEEKKKMKKKALEAYEAYTAEHDGEAIYPAYRGGIAGVLTVASMHFIGDEDTAVDKSQVVWHLGGGRSVEYTDYDPDIHGDLSRAVAEIR